MPKSKKDVDLKLQRAPIFSDPELLKLYETWLKEQVVALATRLEHDTWDAVLSKFGNKSK